MIFIYNFSYLDEREDTHREQLPSNQRRIITAMIKKVSSKKQEKKKKYHQNISYV